MAGVAAGLAAEGMRVFVYGIGPFCYARPYEQLRNNLAMTGLPVCLAANGGGYFYGCLGPSHHALEDCAAMNAIGLKALVPAFAGDIAPMLASHAALPIYLRLGRERRPKGVPVPAYAPWRCLLNGGRGALAALGPLAGAALTALAPCPEKDRPSVWAVTEMPPPKAPPEFCRAARQGPLYIFEDHVASGGLGMQLLYALALEGALPEPGGSAPAHAGAGRTPEGAAPAHAKGLPRRIVHRHALGYPSGRYGSEDFHHKECGLDQETMRALAFTRL
ncbi:hypothetical protein LJC15_03160 [Desulfovibrio sp. OttesenSCG-928-G11]|nr:hypothetical protein [Desulfovibrio sp. OttesenSCG-928-G11]